MKRRVTRSRDLADAFAAFLHTHGVTSFVRDHQAIEGRRWKIDLADLSRKVAVEIQDESHALTSVTPAIAPDEER